MNLGAQSGLLAAIVAAAVAASVLLRVRRGLLSALFTFFSAVLFVHYLASFFENLTHHDFWARLDLGAAALVPVSALLFFGHFLWQRPTLANRFLRPAYAVSGLLIVLLATPWGAHPAVAVVSVCYAFGGMVLCAYLMAQRRRELESRRERARLQYLVIFLLVAVGFMVAGTFPPLFFLRSWADLLSVFFLYFVSQSLMKSRLLDLQELLGRMLTLTVVGLMLAMISGLLALWAGGSAEVSLFHTFLAAMVIFILFEPVRDKMELLTGRLFFQERLELQRKLEGLRREIANLLELPRMTTLLLDTVYDSMRVSHASLYLLEEAGTGYRLAGHRGPQPPERIDAAAHHALFDQLKKTPTVLLAETFERRLEQAPVPEGELPPEAEHARQVLASLRSVQAGICIPLTVSGEVLGLWTLHDDKGLENYSTEEIARLMAVGEQAAINIENSRVFEHLRERDRLAVLGEMAAGLAHEIRNPLGAIKGAAQFLQPEAAGQESAEILRVIVEETDRLNQVVDQFLDYARPFKTKLQPIDVNKVVEHSLRVVAADLESHRVVVQPQLAPGLPSPDGNEQQLTQVVLNLVRNAVEAMPAGGSLTVKTSQRTASPFLRLRPGRRPITVQLEISDTGTGIAPEQLERVFVPFFTTKEKGTGLGLAICQRIVEHHGGALQVRSKLGEGTTFTVTLPCPAPSERPPEKPPEKAPERPHEKPPEPLPEA